MKPYKKTLITFGAIVALYLSNASNAKSKEILNYFHKSKNSEIRIVYIHSGNKDYYYKHSKQKKTCENDLIFIVDEKDNKIKIYAHDHNCDDKTDYIKIIKKRKENDKNDFLEKLTATRSNYNGFKKEFDTIDTFLKKITNNKLEDLVNEQ